MAAVLVVACGPSKEERVAMMAAAQAIRQGRPVSAIGLPPLPWTLDGLRDQFSGWLLSATDVVLGDISVETENELVGTVRSWKATAQAGRRRAASAGAASREDGLHELEGLFARGVISRDEYERKRAAILDEL